MKPNDGDIKNYPCTWPGCPEKFDCAQSRTMHISMKHSPLYHCKFPDCKEVFGNGGEVWRHYVAKHGTRQKTDVRRNTGA